MQGVCQNGDCLNTLGSFKCSCKAGFVLDRNRCVGEFYVFFTRHHMFAEYHHIYSPEVKSRKSSLNSLVLLSETPAEQAKCFLMASEVRGCEHPLLAHLTQEMCCCTVGKAWGHDCERCPQVGTGEWTERRQT